MTASATAARGAAVVVVSGRYQFVPTCACGWTWRGYIAHHAAQAMADAHNAGEV